MTQPTRLSGIIVHWFPEMQRGSILADGSERRIFADAESLTDGYRPQAGERVVFTLRKTADGKAVAADVAKWQAAATAARRIENTDNGTQPAARTVPSDADIRQTAAVPQNPHLAQGGYTAKMPKKHFGTIVHWFAEMQRGSIQPDNSEQRIFADEASLVDSYKPQTGERVQFYLTKTADGKTVAADVALFQPFKENDTVEITVTEWDIAQNAGMGASRLDIRTPVFVLGQFLCEGQTIPQPGDRLTGRLHRHVSGKWVLVDAAAADAAGRSVPEPETERFSDGLDAPPPKSAAAQPLRETPQHLPVGQVFGGAVVAWNEERGQGFIRYGDESQNVLFDEAAFHYAGRRPHIGDEVKFFCRPPVAGERQQAARVVLSEHAGMLSSDTPCDDAAPDRKPLWFALSVTAAAAWLLAVGWLSATLSGIYFFASLAAFWFYLKDKEAVQAMRRNGERSDTAYFERIGEGVLHRCAVIGGWPGALIAQHLLRHKQNQQPFIWLFWATVAANIAMTYVLLVHYADNPVSVFLRN
ncbi:DUF1294 domain-containing protein [Neisseria sp.]|uniref:DUF1294 domain-containing protein n=1 Tax=Neisseria sp. TaxID=192066 RepID=UPI0035A09A18